MSKDPEALEQEYLTKTEIFVLDCRRRGMSDTAIRRLLHLSASDAVAFGLTPTQKPKQQDDPELEERAPDPWPQSAGRRKPFARRTNRQNAKKNRLHRRGRAGAMNPTRIPQQRGDKV